MLCGAVMQEMLHKVKRYRINFVSKKGINL